MNAYPAGLRCVSLFFLPPHAALANLGNSYLLYQQSYVVKSNDTIVYRISASTIKNAYVEIYWASTTACSDKLLAQHVNFKVTYENRKITSWQENRTMVC